MSHSHSTTNSSDSWTTTPAATGDVVCLSTCHRQQQLDVRLQTETPGPASPDARRPGQTYCLGFATGRRRQSRRTFSTTTTVTRGTLAIVIVPRFLTSSSGDLKVSCPSLRFHIDDDFHSASSFAAGSGYTRHVGHREGWLGGVGHMSYRDSAAMSFS